MKHTPAHQESSVSVGASTTVGVVAAVGLSLIMNTAYAVDAKVGQTVTATAPGPVEIKADDVSDVTDNTSPVAADASSEARASSNRVANPANLTNGVSITAAANSKATATHTSTANGPGTVSASASAVAGAQAQAQVNSNQVTNTGSITAARGQVLKSTAAAQASSTATANASTVSGAGDSASASASATANATDAQASTLSNQVANSGRIDATDRGVLFGSETTAENLATATASALAGSGGNSNSSDTSTRGVSRGIAQTGSNTFDNTGLVRVTGPGSIAVDFAASSGSIATFAGTLDTARALTDANVLTNSGLLVSDDGTAVNLASASSGGTDATASVSQNAITNTGRIFGGTGGIALSASSEDGSEILGNSIQNVYGGRIVTGGTGIRLSGNTGAAEAKVQGNAIRNSGLIVSDPGANIEGEAITRSNPAVAPGTAVSITGTADVGASNSALFEAPSYFAGSFEFDRDAKVDVTLRSGVSHSNLWTFADANAANLGAASFTLEGPVPWFRGGGSIATANGVADRFATVDPSALSVATHQLADLSGMAFRLARHGLRSIDERQGFWVAGEGARMDYNGDGYATNDQDTTFEGLAVGYSYLFNSVRVGIVGGCNDSQLEVGTFHGDVYGNSYDNDADGGFGGLFLNGAIGSVTIDLGLAAGTQSHEDHRFVNDNTRSWGIANAASEYDSNWSSGGLRLAMPLTLGQSWTLTPAVDYRHSWQDVDGSVETGLVGDENAAMSGRDLAVGEVNVGLDLTRAWDKVSVSVRGGYLSRHIDGDDSVAVSMIGDTQNVPFFQRDLDSGYAGVDVNCALSESVDLGVSGSVLAGGEVDGGYVGGSLRVKF